jgi:hypothetical protein
MAEHHQQTPGIDEVLLNRGPCLTCELGAVRTLEVRVDHHRQRGRRTPNGLGTVDRLRCLWWSGCLTRHLRGRLPPVPNGERENGACGDDHQHSRHYVQNGAQAPRSRRGHPRIDSDHPLTQRNQRGMERLYSSRSGRSVVDSVGHYANLLADSPARAVRRCCRRHVVGVSPYRFLNSRTK